MKNCPFVFVSFRVLLLWPFHVPFSYHCCDNGVVMGGVRT